MANTEGVTEGKYTKQLVRETTTYMHGFTHRLIKDDNAYIPSLKGRRCFRCMSLCRPNLSMCPFCGADLNEPLTDMNYLPPGALLQRRYLVGELLRSDDACASYIALDTANEQVVTIVEYLPLQIVYRPFERVDIQLFDDKDDELFREGIEEFFGGANMLSKLYCDTVPALLSAFEENNTGYLVTEFFPADSLDTFLGNNSCLNANDTRTIMANVADALSSIHLLGAVHGAVTPDKILVAANGQTKLVWHGCANDVVSEHKKKVITPSSAGFLAEEAYGDPSALTPASDVYSFAAVTYRVLTAELPTHALIRRHAIETKGRDPLSFSRRLFMGSDKQVNIVSLQNAMHVYCDDRPDDILFFYNELFSSQKVKRKKESIKMVDRLGLRLAGKLMISFAAVLLVCVLGLSFVMQMLNLNTFNQSNEDRRIASFVVPDMVGDAYQAVEKEMSDHGVRLIYTYATPSAMFRKGTVLSQDPMPGERMQYGDFLYVVVSAGNEKMIVPDVTGMEFENAQALLEKAGFKVEKKEANVPKYNRNVICRQSISPDSVVDEGSVIELTVSTSSGIYYSSWEFAVPDLLNVPYEAGIKTLSDKGLYFVVDNYIYDASQDAGVIVSQDPPAGTSTKANAVIHITVNRGAVTVCVPDMTHWEYQYAAERLQAMGIQVNKTERPSRELTIGAVLGQNVSPGEIIPAGSTITLVVSSGSTEIVPNLIGMTYAEAKQALYDAHLSIRCVNPENAKKDNDREVMQQSARPGTELPLGSAVELKLED